MRLIVLLALMVAACADRQGVTDTRDKFQVTARPINLEAGSVGVLRFLGGLRLHSSDPRFGGLSGLRWVNGHLYAVTDRSALLRLTLHERNDVLVEISDAFSDQLKADSDGLIHEAGDAEALEIDPSGAIVLVAFEGRNRIHTYRNLASERHANPLDPKSLQPLPHNDGPDSQMENWPANAGSKAFALFEWDCMICNQVVLSEGAPGPSGSTAAFLLRESGKRLVDELHDEPLPEVIRFSYRAPRGQRPTDAVALDARTLLILNQGDTGPASLTRLHLADIKTDGPLAYQSIAPVRDGGTVSGRVIASLPDTLANYRFEGLAMRKEGARVFLYLVNDNGFAPNHPSLLLKFELLD